MVAVSSGPGSRQNYQTPADFMRAADAKFGPITFDLAAEPHNKQHDRYYGPHEFVERGTAEDLMLITRSQLYSPHVKFIRTDKKKGAIYERRTPNHDPHAVALNSLVQDWSDLADIEWLNPAPCTCKVKPQHVRQSGEKSGTAPNEGVGQGQQAICPNCGKVGNARKAHSLCFLNPPFADIAPWVSKCRFESLDGAHILFLVPASVGSDWFARDVWQRADVYFLTGRLSFDGKAPYPKDCMLIHYHPQTNGSCQLWDWRCQATRIDSTPTSTDA